MANLIIDIGNTALKAAWADGITLGKTYRYQGERTMDFILSLTEKVKPETLVISSAKDLSAGNLARLERECRNLLVLDATHSHIMEENGLPTYLTPDRAASIIASRFLFKGKGCTIMDFGTTLAVDFLDEEGNYTGGNLSVGCRTRFKALNRYSNTLPLVDTPEEYPVQGKDVESSIMAGVVQGILYEIEGYRTDYPQNIIVFTGGDSIYFAKRMKNSIFVVCNLVLMGLALIADKYGKIN